MEPDTQPTPLDTQPSQLMEPAPPEAGPQRNRRLLWLAGGGALAVVAATLTIGWLLGASRSQQRVATEIEQARTEVERARVARDQQQQAAAQARKLGESALAMHDNGLFAPAAAALGRLDAAARAQEGGAYAQAARFLTPRLLTFDEAARTVASGDAVRWRDSNLVRGPDGALKEVGGRPIAAHVFSTSGSQLVVVDVDRQAWIYQWPALTATGPHSLGVACVDSVEALPDGRFAVNAMADPAIAGGEGAAGPTMRIVLGPDGSLSPATPREGAGSKCAAARRSRNAVAAMGAVRQLRFPRLRDEAAFWREATARGLSKEMPSVLPLDLRPKPPYGELDVSALPGTGDQRSAMVRHLGTEAVTTGLVRLDGRSIAMSMHVTGSHATTLNLCEFDPASRKVKACGAVPMSAATYPVFSGDHRRALLAGPENQQDPFRLLDVARLGARCKVGEHPGARVATAAFNARGDRLAIVTLDRELWTYELAADCEARLVLRQALPAPREDGRGSLAWLDAGTLVWVAGEGDVFAIEARTGLLRWSQRLLWPLEARGVKVRTSDDAKLFVLFDQRHLQLASVASGAALSGMLDARALKSADARPGELCDVEIAGSGEVWLRTEAGSCSASNPNEALAGKQWRRLAPDDPQLNFDSRPGLWRRTAISERDGRLPVLLKELLTP